jgi:hypothetical protein
MDEENQSYDGSEREDQGAGNARYRSERLRQAARCGQRGHAVKKRSKEDSKSPLGHPISDEAHEDARRELHRGERQSHQENREHDRDDGHDRTSDRRQHDLSDLGIGTGWKQRVRDPGAYASRPLRPTAAVVASENSVHLTGVMLQEMSEITLRHGVPLPASLTLIGKALAQVHSIAGMQQRR